MTKLVITRGYPASGKTTYARRWVNEDPSSRCRINRDDLRATLYAKYTGLTFEQEQKVTEVQRAAVEAALRVGQSVIVDDTNLRLRNARAWADLALRLGVEFEVVDIPSTLLKCQANDLLRRACDERFVGTEVITDFARRYPMPWPEVKPTPRKADSPPEPYVPDESLPDAWLVDIDGTVAKMNGRDPHDYHRVSEDLPNSSVIEVVEALYRAGNDIVFLSGRKDSCGEQTRDWLEYELGQWTRRCELHMRKADDNRSDFIVKAELFDKYVRHRYHVVGALDDRDQVVALWRSMGITCLQVDYGNF